jgi:adenylate cyclase
VPAGLVRQLIEMGQEAKLGGERKRLTIFFSDIAGFSGISERLPPEELVVRLAEYLGALSDVIQRRRGTVDKYIGDAIMAFWGAPVEMENPELVAVETALECRAEARRINERWIAEGLDVAFHIRVGINTGELIVGNMGSESRLNYTVIGDAVNLASRLEGANKAYRTEIMISESTYEAVSGSIACRIIDKVRVKGRNEPIMVYEPVGRRDQMGDPTISRIDLHNEAWYLYAGSKFREAALLFRKIYLEDKSNDLAAEYSRRCAAYVKTPPGPDWDAVNVLKEK